METIIFSSHEINKNRFVVFYDDRLIAVTLTKSFVKNRHHFMRGKSGGFFEWIIDHYKMDRWITFPNDSFDINADETREYFKKIILLKYTDITKFKLSSKPITITEGVRSTYPGTLLIKGDGKKISIDHDYKSSDSIYKQVIKLKKKIT